MSKQEYTEYDIINMNTGEVVEVDSSSFDNLVQIGAIDMYSKDGKEYFDSNEGQQFWLDI